MRDEFRKEAAIAAMQGILQRNDIFVGDVDAVCRLSVKFADGLLKHLYNADNKQERKKTIRDSQQFELSQT